tara:strand:- start:2699 stop:3427 length:729 start_codon:yes stop_codon:yes gene_type:complete
MNKIDLEKERTINLKKLKVKLKKYNLNNLKKSKMCNSVINTCMYKNLDTKYLTKDRILEYIDILLFIVCILISVLIIYYILCNDLDFHYKLIKILLFIVNYKLGIGLYILYKFIYPSFKYGNYTNVSIIKHILENNKEPDTMDVEINMSTYFKYLFSKEFKILHFDSKCLIKSLTNVNKESNVYKKSILKDNDRNIIGLTKHLIYVTFMLWDYPFLSYYDIKQKKCKNLKDTLTNLDNKNII